jgi:hypothetical protein
MNNMSVVVERALKFTVLLALVSATAGRARAGAPNACQVLTPALVSNAIGRPVTGGTMSVEDHVGASA